MKCHLPQLLPVDYFSVGVVVCLNGSDDDDDDGHNNRLAILMETPTTPTPWTPTCLPPPP